MFVGDDGLFGVDILVQRRTTAKSSRRAGGANVLQNDFVADEGFASPVCAEEAEYPMLD